MGTPVLKVKEYSPEEIKALIRKDERYAIELRLYAVYQVTLGRPSRKLEETYHKGEEALPFPRTDGALSDLLLNGFPVNHGYNTQTWTDPMLIDWVGKNIGVEFKKAQIYNIIK